MSATEPIKSTSVPIDSEGPMPAGVYPFGPPDKVSSWDSHAWDGKITDQTGEPGIPKLGHKFLPFLGHTWFWLVVTGTVLSLIPAYFASTMNSAAISWLCLPGFVIFMLGTIGLVTRHLRYKQITDLRVILVCGLAAGVVAFLIAFTIESYLEPLVVTLSTELWLAGVVEESAKLLVPVLLLAFGAARFKDPRAGVLMALISGAFFGAAEAVLYTTFQGNVDYGFLTMAMGRPVGEMLHPLLTSMAAAVIWIAAWRAKKTITAAGILAWVVAMAVHSFHDGLATLGSKPPVQTGQHQQELAGAIIAGTGLLAYGLLWTVIIYLMARHTIRELVPPDAIAANSKHWRPRIKAWGLPKNERTPN